MTRQPDRQNGDSMPTTPPAEPSRPDHGGSHGPAVTTGEQRSGGTRMRSKSALLAAIRQQRRAALVVNTRSRRGIRLYQAAASQLHAAGFGLLGSFPVSQPGQLQASLDDALDLTPDLLIVGGGDGTLSLAARHLAHRDVALGVLPLGTTNNFARTLAIPLNVAGRSEEHTSELQS